jgi:hypothetical protein
LTLYELVESPVLAMELLATCDELIMRELVPARAVPFGCRVGLGRRGKLRVKRMSDEQLLLSAESQKKI